jgi:hydroxypyruvate isomerase
MSDLKLSACVEMLFTEADRPFVDRVRAAAEAGCEGIEFWSWRDKPLDALADAIAETGVAVPMMVVDPFFALVDAGRLAEFVEAVRGSAVAARRIGCRALVAVSGNALSGIDAADQNEAIVGCLRAAAPVAGEHGIKLLLEPLNTRIDHPGTYLSSTSLGLDLVERVDRPEVRLLYDVYHSVVMGEDPAEVLRDRGELLGHVHVADTNGRHEPGTGSIDWDRTIAVLLDAGYRGFIGMEYRPTVDSADSMQLLRDALGSSESA